jgi:hypothetical protein
MQMFKKKYYTHLSNLNTTFVHNDNCILSSLVTPSSTWSSGNFDEIKNYTVNTNTYNVILSENSFHHEVTKQLAHILKD